MSQPASLLMIEFLDWVAYQPRTYADAMEAWRSSCPRLTVWEDALSEGLIQVDGGPRLRDYTVRLTPPGAALLNGRRTTPPPAAAPRQSSPAPDPR